MVDGHRNTVSFCYWVAAMLAATVAVADDEFRVGGPLPPSVVKSWQNRREACASVYWKLNCRELMVKGAANTSQEQIDQFGPIPKEDSWRENIYESWIDFPTLRVRNFRDGTLHGIKQDGNPGLLRSNDTSLFDGVSLQTLTDGQELSERRPEGQGMGLVFVGCQAPLFWGRGIVFGPDIPCMPSKLNNKLDPEKFRIYAIERDDDATRLIVRINTHSNTAGNFNELTIDMDRECAIVRSSITSSGRLYSELNAKWAQTEAGWDPISWTEVIYQPDGKLLLSGECVVIEQVCEPDLSKIIFHVNPKPGTRYWDERTDTTYVKSPDGKPDIPEKLYDIQIAANSRRISWILSAVVVVVSLGVAVYWYRRFHAE